MQGSKDGQQGGEGRLKFLGAKKVTPLFVPGGDIGCRVSVATKNAGVYQILQHSPSGVHTKSCHYQVLLH